MAQGIIAQRVEDILKALKENGVRLGDAASINIDYKEMGECAGDIVVPVISIKIK